MNGKRWICVFFSSRYLLLTPQFIPEKRWQWWWVHKYQILVNKSNLGLNRKLEIPTDGEYREKKKVIFSFHIYIFSHLLCARWIFCCCFTLIATTFDNKFRLNWMRWKMNGGLIMVNLYSHSSNHTCRYPPFQLLPVFAAYSICNAFKLVMHNTNSKISFLSFLFFFVLFVLKTWHILWLDSWIHSFCLWKNEIRVLMQFLHIYCSIIITSSSFGLPLDSFIMFRSKRVGGTR